MTDIQIKYWDLQEGKRHNVATESETYRHNVTGEQQNLLSLSESKRHNVATEKVARENAISQRMSASASQQQAVASLSQASSAARRAASEVSLNAAKESGQKISNEIASASKVASIVGNYGKAASEVVGTIGKVVETITGAAKLAAIAGIAG